MSQKPMKKICLSTGGGDCPGLNAVIRAVTKKCLLDYGWEVWGSKYSFDGFFLPEKMVQLTLESVRGILHKGGTILKTTNQGDPFRYPDTSPAGELLFRDRSDELVTRFRELEFDALVVIGGDGTLSIAQRLSEKGVSVVGVPKTIDNDVLGTEITFGFDTAVTTATEAIDRLHSTAESHDRVLVVEVMGRNAGWIALASGIAGGADVILIPEIPYRGESVLAKLRDRLKRGRTFSLIVVAEGAFPKDGERVFLEKESATYPYGRLGGVAYQVRDWVQENAQMEARVVVLGHLQRGGSPTSFDRILGTRLGLGAAELIEQEMFGRMVCVRCGKIESIPIGDAISQQRLVDPHSDYVKAARAVGISLGNE